VPWQPTTKTVPRNTGERKPSWFTFVEPPAAELLSRWLGLRPSDRSKRRLRNHETRRRVGHVREMQHPVMSSIFHGLWQPSHARRSAEPKTTRNCLGPCRLHGMRRTMGSWRHNVVEKHCPISGWWNAGTSPATRPACWQRAPQEERRRNPRIPSPQARTFAHCLWDSPADAHTGLPTRPVARTRHGPRTNTVLLSFPAYTRRNGVSHLLFHSAGLRRSNVPIQTRVVIVGGWLKPRTCGPCG
jgi:hypothetical protein